MSTWKIVAPGRLCILSASDWSRELLKPLEQATLDYDTLSHGSYGERRLIFSVFAQRWPWPWRSNYWSTDNDQFVLLLTFFARSRYVCDCEGCRILLLRRLWFKWENVWAIVKIYGSPRNIKKLPICALPSACSQFNQYIHQPLFALEIVYDIILLHIVHKALMLEGLMFEWRQWTDESIPCNPVGSVTKLNVKENQ